MSEPAKAADSLAGLGRDRPDVLEEAFEIVTRLLADDRPAPGECSFERGLVVLGEA